MTMPIEATEHTGPIVVWRKELRPDSGGDGRVPRRSRPDHRDRGGCRATSSTSPPCSTASTTPPRGRDGGETARRASVALDDGTVLQPKGWQHVPAGRRLVLQLPGGGGYRRSARTKSEAARPKDVARATSTEEEQMSYISSRLSAVKPSASMAVSQAAKALARQGHRRDRPWAWRAGFSDARAHRRGRLRGRASGRHALHGARSVRRRCARRSPAKFKRENGLDYGLDEIVVANGAKQIIFNALMATLESGRRGDPAGALFRVLSGDGEAARRHAGRSSNARPQAASA